MNQFAPGVCDMAGVRLTGSSTQAGAVHRPVVALATTAILVAGTVVFFALPSLRIHLTAARSPWNPAKPDKSIAVLPFENLSSDPDNAFFADGVQDDI